MALLDVKDLRVEFRTADGVVHAVNGVSFEVDRGRVLGIVGESGSGKSVTCLTTLGLTNRPGVSRQVSGTATFNGRNLLTMTGHELRQIRGRDIAMIFQDPMTSLNPVMSIGAQMAEAILLHDRVPHNRARERSRDMLTAVGIPQPETRLKAYPHELSGGMRQRAMIAMALLNNPDLLIADEPTTALDVTTQAQILALIGRLRTEFDSAIILVTHDLGVVAEMCDDVLVMYAGRIVEKGPVDAIFDQPFHPYTWGLLGCLPRLNFNRRRLTCISGAPPSLLSPPPGCVFHPRCPHVMPICSRVIPDLNPVMGTDSAHRAACHLPDDFKVQKAAELLRAQIEAAG